MKHLLGWAAAVAVVFAIPAWAEPVRWQGARKVVNVSVSENPAPQATPGRVQCQPGALPVYSHRRGAFWCADATDYEEIAGSSH